MKPKKSAEDVAAEKARVAAEKKAAKEIEKARIAEEKKAAKEAEKRAAELKAATTVSLSTKVKIRTPSTSPAPSATEEMVSMKKPKVAVLTPPEVSSRKAKLVEFNGEKVWLDYRRFMWTNDNKALGDFMGVYNEKGKLDMVTEEDAKKAFHEAHPEVEESDSDSDSDDE